MKKFLNFAAIFAALTLAFTACTPKQTYDKNGISFKYPEGWSITADEYSADRGYLTLEKDGSSAKVTIGWLNLDVNIGADRMLENALEGLVFENALADLVPTPAKDAAFGDYPARSLTYTATADGVPQSGTAWVFKADGCVVNAATQQAVSEFAANANAFEMIADSFKLK